MSKTKADKPFCEGCDNADESQTFSSEDVIQELKWALECAQTRKSPLTSASGKKKSAIVYLKERIDEIKSDEEDARMCESCNRNEKDTKREEVEFT